MAFPLTKHEFEPYTVFDGTLREGDLSAIPALRGTEDRVGAWLSLVEHLVRDQGVGGSNPLAPTNIIKHLLETKRPPKEAFFLRGNALGNKFELLGWPTSPARV